MTICSGNTEGDGENQEVVLGIKQRIVFCDEVLFRALCGVYGFEPYLFSVLLLSLHHFV